MIIRLQSKYHAKFCAISEDKNIITIIIILLSVGAIWSWSQLLKALNKNPLYIKNVCMRYEFFFLGNCVQGGLIVKLRSEVMTGKGTEVKLN